MPNYTLPVKGLTKYWAVFLFLFLYKNIIPKSDDGAGYY